jgi:phosphoglycolate phosphatase-like HAD superfamily hydrolase
VRIHDVLVRVSLRLGELRQAAESAGRNAEVELWRYVREHLFFILRTGHVYRFEDYLRSLDAARTSLVSPAFSAREDTQSQQAMALLVRTLEETTEPEQKQSTLVIINLLNFIAETAQYDEFDDYLEDYYADPLPAIAHFDTREEAEAWLRGAVEPPGGTHILIGDEYYQVWYSREDGVRELLRDHVIEPWLEQLTSKGLPAAIASFNTREEAEQWLKIHPVPPMSFVTIAGEHHLAAYHRRLNHHTLHPLSSLKEWEAEKKRRDEEPEAADDGPKAEE